METDTNTEEDAPTTAKKDTVLDVDGNEVKRTTFVPEDTMQFGHLLINALYGSNIKEETPPEERKKILAEIAAVCLIRGIDALGDEVDALDDDFGAALSMYSRKTLTRIQDVANRLFTVEKEREGGIRMQGDRDVLDFLKSKGVVHMPTKRLHKFDKEGAIEGLKKMFSALGMPEEEMDRIVNGMEADFSSEGISPPTPGCDCPGCAAKRELMESSRRRPGSEKDDLFTGMPGADNDEEQNSSEEASS